MASILFFVGYAATIWGAFLVLVLTLLPGHPAPIPFSAMFLTLWPLITAGAGVEGFVAVDKVIKQQMNDAVESSRIKQRQLILCGMRVGVIVALTGAAFSGIAFWLSLWILIAAVVVVWILPALLYERYSKRLIPKLETSAEQRRR